MSEIAQENYLYERVADKIARFIDQGTLESGERLPSVRKLRAQLGVSMGTVLQAYWLLENKGLIEVRPQSGYYVRQRSQDLPAEPMMSEPISVATQVGVGELISEILAAARNPDMVPLGATGPSPELFPTLKLNRVLASVARRSGMTNNIYDFSPGNELLRRQIARRSLEWGGSLTTEEIVTTCGCTEALNLCLKAVAKPGDTIAIESPAHFGFLQILESLGMKTLEIPTHPRDGISLDALEFAIESHTIKACLLSTNFSNPLGSCMPNENKQRLVEMLSQRQIPLIEDDVAGNLYFGSERPKAAKAFDQEGMVLLCSSFSKDLAPGYRVGWTAPGRFRTQVERLKHVSTLATATLPQLAIAEFLHDGGYDHHLRKIRRAYATQVQRVTQAISQYFPEGTKVTRPTGGFLLWVELPESVDALELHQQALKEKISITPGPIFSATRKYHNYIRLNCGHPWSVKIEQALLRLGYLAQQA